MPTFGLDDPGSTQGVLATRPMDQSFSLTTIGVASKAEASQKTGKIAE
jgi:hypothetical protein